MKTSDLLSCISAGAETYIRQTLGSKSTSDHEKLTKLFGRNLLAAKSFKDTELDILTFDWQSLEKDRNWWWQIQALPFLNWYVNSFELQKKTERETFFFSCLKAIDQWIASAQSNGASPLVWHDHATAFRVRNIANWLLFCNFAGLPVQTSPEVEPLGKLIIDHLDWLRDERHYSRHTNHGLDQAMIALTIGLFFDHKRFQPYCQLNRERLKDEVTAAFFENGVHKENSPGYQKTMLARLKQLRTIAPLGDTEISNLGEKYITNAEHFLRSITPSNGFLPMIGDTRGEDKGLPYHQKDRIDIIDYSASGYVIVRGKTDFGLSIFLLVKNTHESDYHRHDDDLMIFLEVNGQTVFGDGGLGTHHESDQRRKHLRSVNAHTMPIVDRPFIRRKANLDSAPRLALMNENRLIQGTSMGHGVKVTRSIDISRFHEGFFTVKDECREENIWSNWLIDCGRVLMSQSELEINFHTHKVHFGLDADEPVSVYRGWNEKNMDTSAIMSSEYGTFFPSTRILIGPNTNQTKVNISLSARRTEDDE